MKNHRELIAFDEHSFIANHKKKDCCLIKKKPKEFFQPAITCETWKKILEETAHHAISTTL